jgi:CRP-like cAMP-binding protein
MESSADALIDIVRKVRKTKTQMLRLYEKFKNFDFFRNYLRNDQKELLFDLLSKIKLEEHDSYSVVFKRGELSNKFYIILEGEVSVLLDSDADRAINKCPYPEIKEKFATNPMFFCQQTKNFLMNQVLVIKTGQAFGELGLLQGKPRLATVLTTRKCFFGVLSSQDFMSTLQPTILSESDIKMRYFKHLLDGRCSSDEILKLSALFQRVRFDKYQTLFCENEDFSKIYIIVEGLVQLERNILFEAEEDKILKDDLILSLSTRIGNRTSLRQDKTQITSTRDNDYKESNFEPVSVANRVEKNSFRKSKEANPLYRKLSQTKINSQPIIIYGQNQFLGFKEFLENNEKILLRCKSH